MSRSFVDMLCSWGRTVTGGIAPTHLGRPAPPALSRAKTSRPAPSAKATAATRTRKWLNGAKRDAPPKGGALWGTTGRRDVDPRAWICQKSLDQAKSGPLRTAIDRLNQMLTGAQLAHRKQPQTSYFSSSTPHRENCWAGGESRWLKSNRPDCLRHRKAPQVCRAGGGFTEICAPQQGSDSCLRRNSGSGSR